MEGLEKILNAIAADAQKQSDGIVEDANLQAQAIKKDADNKARAEYNSVVDTANMRAKRIISSADSFGELDYANKTLAYKRAMIDRVFDRAAEKLCKLNTTDYFTVIAALVKKYAENGEGELVFNSNDLKRITPSIEEGICKMLPSGKSVKVCATPDDTITGGCRIKYGNIEVNCAFDALCNEYRETATADVAKILFD